MKTTETGACRLENIVIDGHPAIRLSNGFIEADLIPSLGGKVWSLVHSPSRTQWLWHNPGVALNAVEPEACYDDNWAGGWEELFPNDAPGIFQGRTLPDHGEWWSSAWSLLVAESSDEMAVVQLELECRSVQARCRKRIELRAGSSQLNISYRIENLEPGPIHFMFKQHLALAVTPDHRLELSGGLVCPVDTAFGTRLGGRESFQWPIGKDKSGGPVDLSTMPPPQDKQREFVYVSDLPEGWCGVLNTVTDRRLRVKFSRDVFPFTWLFSTYGGWRGLYTVVLEPCTNMPKDLGEAFRLGRCAKLERGESLETTVEVSLE